MGLCVSLEQMRSFVVTCAGRRGSVCEWATRGVSFDPENGGVGERMVTQSWLGPGVRELGNAR